MATRDGLSNITSPARETPLNTNFRYISDKLDEKELNLQSKITLNDNNIEILNLRLSEHDIIISENTDDISNTIAKINNHILAISDKHNSQDINYTGLVIGATETKTAIDSIKIQLDAATIGAGTSPAEVTSARAGITTESNATLKDRVDKIESNIGKITSISTSTTLTSTQRGIINVTTGSSNLNITLPVANTTTVMRFTIKKVDSGVGTATVLTQSSQLIDDQSSILLQFLGDSITVVNNGTGWNIIGDTRNKNAQKSPLQTMTGNINSLPSTAVLSQISDLKLSGTSANSIVTNGNFSNSTTGWSNLSGSHSVLNNILTNTADGTGIAPAERQDASTTVTTNKKVFIRATLRVTNANCQALRIRVGSSGTGSLINIANQTNPVQNQWYTIYATMTYDASYTGNVVIIVRHDYADVATANGKVMEVKEVVAIDMGTDSNNPYYSKTANEMNILFPNYLGYGVKNSQPQRVKVVGKNLFNINGKNLGTRHSGDYVSNDVLRTYANASFELGTRYLLRLKPNTIYTAKYNIALGGDATGNYTEFKHFTNNVLIEAHTGASTTRSLTFTSSSDGYFYINFVRVGGGDNSLGWMDVSNFQLEEGSVATTYEPYKTTEVTAPELPTKWDSFNPITGEYIKWGNTIVLNGSETWGQYTFGTRVNTVVFRVTPTLALVPAASDGVVPSNLWNDKFSNISFDNIYNNDIEGTTTRNGEPHIYISILKSKLATQDVAGFKTWLASNNVTCKYQLANYVSTYYPPQSAIVGANYTMLLENATQEVKVTNGEGIVLKYPVKTVDNIIKINGETKTDVASTDISIYRENTSVTAEAGTTSTNIKITGHGLSINDRIFNVTRNTVSRVTAVVDANNITIAVSIVSQTTGDTIKTFKTSVTDISKTAIIVIANSVSGNEYIINYYLDESNSTIPQVDYKYSLNTAAVIEDNTKTLAQHSALIRQLILSSLQ